MSNPTTIKPVLCPRCNRPMVGWPIKRADICSPKYWANCIRNPRTAELDGEAEEF